MNTVDLIKKILAVLPGGLSTLITIGSFFLPDETKEVVSRIPCGWKIVILITVLFCSATCVYITFKKPHKQYTFEFRSEEFIRFFNHWYLQKGKISVVCKDLDWTVEGQEQSILNALRKKAENKELNLYLTTKDGDIVNNLRQLGANVYSRPNAISNYVFSFVEIMGNTTNNIIFRDKNDDPPGKVIFEERKDDRFLRLLLQTVVEHESV